VARRKGRRRGRRKRGRKYNLLIYDPLWDRWGNLGILAFIISLILWIAAPSVLAPPFDRGMMRHMILLASAAGLLLFLYGLAARKWASVQCFPNYVRVQGPIYPLIISYRRVEGTRPLQIGRLFNIDEEKRARNMWPEKYWGMTGISLDLGAYPVSENWLRLWFDRYLFNPQAKGFILLVEDWLSFSRELNEYLSAYRLRHQR
jgi:hypothetical protein